MLPLNDDWLSWPPESLDSFFKEASADDISQQSIPAGKETEACIEEMNDETGR